MHTRLRLLQRLKLGFSKSKVVLATGQTLIQPRQARHEIVRKLRRAGIEIMDKSGGQRRHRLRDQFQSSA